MARLTTADIRKIALELIMQNPEGIGIKDIVSGIIQRHPNAHEGTIRVQVSYMARDSHKDEIERFSRGIYRPMGKIEDFEDDSLNGDEEPETYNEEDFYEPFADFLTSELDECSTAAAIGSMRGNGKWGNPDVVGINKPLPHHVIKFEPEIIAAEIKINPNDTVTAFGQAVAYRLFSHKTYLVLPNTVTEAESAKMLLLYSLYGIGLVYFDLDPKNANFSTSHKNLKFVA